MTLAFSSALDIVNQAGQLLGVDAITLADFEGNPFATKQGREFNRAYDKLRVRELMRNCWTFSTRRFVLRPIDTSTQLWKPPAYSAGTTYTAGAVTNYQGDYYQAQPGVAAGDNPVTALTWIKYFGPLTVEPHVVGSAYFVGEIVSASSVNYLSLISNNTDTPPTANWLALGGTLAAIQILYPLGTGPRSQSSSLNVFKLPYGYLRKCPKNPKANLNTWVGGPSYNQEDDYVTEGGYIVSQCSTPIFIRCVVDMIDVQNMSPMFCHALAAQVAWQMCEPITQAKDKKDDAAARYKWAIAEAGTVDGIEEGAVDPVEDEYVMCRL